MCQRSTRVYLPDDFDTRYMEWHGKVLKSAELGLEMIRDTHRHTLMCTASGTGIAWIFPHQKAMYHYFPESSTSPSNTLYVALLLRGPHCVPMADTLCPSEPSRPLTLHALSVLATKYSFWLEHLRPSDYELTFRALTTWLVNAPAMD